MLIGSHETHPAADAFPLMDEESLKGLAAAGGTDQALAQFAHHFEGNGRTGANQDLKILFVQGPQLGVKSNFQAGCARLGASQSRLPQSIRTAFWIFAVGQQRGAARRYHRAFL